MNYEFNLVEFTNSINEFPFNKETTKAAVDIAFLQLISVNFYRHTFSLPGGQVRKLSWSFCPS